MCYSIHRLPLELFSFCWTLLNPSAHVSPLPVTLQLLDLLGQTGPLEVAVYLPSCKQNIITSISMTGEKHA